MALVVVVSVVLWLLAPWRERTPELTPAPEQVSEPSREIEPPLNPASILDESPAASLVETVVEEPRVALPQEGEPLLAPLRGRLVDKLTGEALPEFVVEIRGPRPEPIRLIGGDEDRFSLGFELPPKRVEKVTTDPAGNFTTHQGFEPGLLEFVLHDLADARQHPAAPGVIEHTHSPEAARRSEEQVFEVRVGPTYRIDVTLPEGTQEDDFFATIPADIETGNPVMHRTVAEDPGSPLALFYGSSSSRSDTLEPRTPLRSGEPRWVRFRAPILFQRVSGGLSELHLRSADGFWAGAAAIASVRGVHPEPVRIELTQCGAIEGRILDSEGKPLPSSWVQLAQDDEAIHEQGADARGGLSFRWLAPGEYQLVITNDRYLEWTATVTVTAGESTRLDVGMVSAGRLGTIAGALRSRTGRHRSKGGILTLTSKEDPSFYLIKGVRYRKRSGQYEAAFAFEDVPVGRYELTLDPLDNRRWSALTLEVSAPATGVDFWCEDEAATFELAFRVLAARTDAPIESPWTAAWMGDPATDRRLDDNWESGTYLGVPEGVPIRWLVSAPGCRPVWGDETAFTSEGATRVAEVRLEPGWGKRFVVTHDGNEPLPGVEVRIDGESAGRTDSTGSLFVERAAKPARLEFVLEGWHVTWGRVDPSDPGFDHGLESPVYLKRDE